MEHCAKNFFEKLPENMFKTRLDTFGNDFEHSWNIEIFLFLNFFEDSTLHGTLGKIFFRKNYPKTCSKHVWTLLGTILGIFGFLKIFWFFWKFSKTRPSMEHWAKNFFEKITPKHVQNTFGHFWERFWAFLEFWKFFDFFLKIFEDSTVHGTLGKIFFRKKNYPKTCSKHVWTLLGTILGIFLFLKNFWFFWKFSKTRPSMEHWAKNFSEKITPKHVQNTFGHFWERFWAFLEFWNFFDFFENFRRLDPPWNTGQKNFSKKLTQNMFKTRLDTFGNDFVRFWIFENFLIFLKIFEDSTVHGTLGKKFFRKNYPKTSSKHVWTLLGTILGIFLFLKIFWFFWKFSKTRPSMEHWAKNFSEKNTPNHVQNTFGHFRERFWLIFEFWKFFGFFENFEESTLHGTLRKKFFEKLPENMFKTRLDTFGNDFEHFWNIENFLFLNFFEDSTLHGTLGKKFFRKNYPKTCSKHVWTLLGTILGIFRFLKIFWFFWKFSKTRPSMEHWAKKFFEKINPKYVQNTFGHFWERFWAFLDFWKFFDFFENFRRLDRPWNTGQNFFSKKLPQNMFKTRLDTFGNDFGHFWIFENFLIFLKVFEDSTVHGTLGKKFFEKNYPKTCSKHVWTLLGTILGIFLFLKNFWFFWKFSKTRPSMEHWAKKFFEKNNPKHVQNTFGHFWERFWAFLDFWKFFDFFENFRRLDRPWNTGQNFFSKKLPQNMFKTRLDTFGNDIGHFSIFENFLIFLKIFEDSTLHGTLGKKIFRQN